jgi:hypothetical protein
MIAAVVVVMVLMAVVAAMGGGKECSDGIIAVVVAECTVLYSVSDGSEAVEVMVVILATV